MEYERYDPEKHGPLPAVGHGRKWDTLVFAAKDGPVVFISTETDVRTRNGISQAARAKGLKAHLARMGDSRYCLSVDAQ